MAKQLLSEAEEQVDRIMERVRREVEDLLRWSYGIEDEEEPPAASEIEEKVRDLVRRLGRELLLMGMGSWEHMRHKGKEKCPRCGEAVYWTRYEPKNCITTLGAFMLERAYYHHGPCHCGWVPLDERLKLKRSELSPLAEEMVAYLGGFLPFAQACHFLKRYIGMEISPDTVNNATVRVGRAFRRQQEEETHKAWEEGEIPPYEGAEPPDRLYVSVDGINHLEPDGQGREIKVGCVYETEERASADRGVEVHAIHTEYVVASDPESLARGAYLAANKRGLHEAARRIVLGDGARWIWNRVAPTLRVPDCTEIVDFFHATSYIWHAAESIYGPGSQRTKAWAEQACHKLKHEGPQTVMSDLGALPVPRNKPADAINDALRYLKNHASRMNYPTYQQEGLQIGSGSAESAVNRVVGTRINQSGMRWRHNRAECVAHVRAAVLSGDRWANHWAAHQPSLPRRRFSPDTARSVFR